MHKGISIHAVLTSALQTIVYWEYAIVKQEKQESVCLFLLLKLMRLI